MSYKMKICWKWVGNEERKATWLHACAPDFGSFDVYCDAEDAYSLSRAGVESSNAWEQSGDEAQAMLLALLASGEIQAAVWIDDRDSMKNWTVQAMGICRSKGVALAVEPAGAAAMLAALKLVLDEQNKAMKSDDGVKNDTRENELSISRFEGAISKAASFKMQVRKAKQFRRMGMLDKKRRNL